ncbi:UPF0149 family protein [Lentisalinibacter salinarum]|uniref:UPF0149 family protein n=1 Tax=Lentisalinibacter salinarum TaxID=2992239 RepID=UPI00386DE4A6
MSDHPNPIHTRLQETLSAAGATCDVPEAHGTLCSLVCLHGSRAGPRWIASLFGNEPVPADARRALLDIASETAAELEDPSFRFAPLLPADRAPMGERAGAMAHWAQGFLHGFGEAGSRPALAERLGQEPLAELLSDLSEITRATADEAEVAEEGMDADEEAWAELVEYLRVAVQLFFLELAAIRGDRHEAPSGLQ